MRSLFREWASWIGGWETPCRAVNLVTPIVRSVQRKLIEMDVT